MHCSSFQSISRKMFTRICARAVWFKISIGPGNIFGHLAPVRKINLYTVSFITNLLLQKISILNFGCVTTFRRIISLNNLTWIRMSHQCIQQMLIFCMIVELQQQFLLVFLKFQWEWDYFANTIVAMLEHSIYINL